MFKIFFPAEACECDEGFTGAKCDLASCPDTIALTSLGFLLLDVTWPAAARHLSRNEDFVGITAALQSADADGDSFLGHLRHDALRRLPAVQRYRVLVRPHLSMDERGVPTWRHGVPRLVRAYSHADIKSYGYPDGRADGLAYG